MNIRFHPFDLELKEIFKISRESRRFQPTLIVELFENEISGFGEATATKYYGQSISEMIEVLERIRPTLANYSFNTPKHFLKDFDPFLERNSFIKCALDCAAHDFYGKKLGKPLHEIWNLSWEHIPLTNYTIGIDSIEKMIEKIQAKPWPIYKIKLGTNEDLNIIEAIRAHTDAIIRVDANNGWTANQTIEFSNVLKDLGVEFIEQPLPPHDLKGIKKVFEKSALPIIADESCLIESDVEKCHEYFHGINIKLMKCGGLISARKMISKARELGLKIMVGCMTESSVGISAIAQLLPLIDYLDMDGPLLIKNDPAESVQYDFGKIIVPKRNGLGVILKNSL